MAIALAIAGGLLGLFITGSALLTVWFIADRTRKEEKRLNRKLDPLDVAGETLGRWSLMDAALVVLFALGMLLLLADAMAVLRDRAAFPPYHALYLVCGIAFVFLGMLILLLRLLLLFRTLQLTRHHPVSPKHHHEPDHTDHAE